MFIFRDTTLHHLKQISIFKSVSKSDRPFGLIWFLQSLVFGTFKPKLGMAVSKLYHTLASEQKYTNMGKYVSCKCKNHRQVTLEFRNQKYRIF